MKHKYLQAYMDMTERFAQTSEANRLKVAAIIVKNDAIISLGINGTPAGFHTNNCEDSNGDTEWFVRHAECAALDKLVNSTETAKGSTMFCNYSPCGPCSLRIVDAGITKVYYRHSYRDTAGVSYLRANGVSVEVLE